MALQLLLLIISEQTSFGPTARPACRPAVFRTAVPEASCTDQLFCTTKATNLLAKTIL